MDKLDASLRGEIQMDLTMTSKDLTKEAFREWLCRLASEKNLLTKNGRVVVSRIAKYFGVSFPTAQGWMSKTGNISTRGVLNIITPRAGIDAVQFWHEIEAISKELSEGGKEKKDIQWNDETSMTASMLIEHIKTLPSEERKKLKKLYLLSVAEGVL